MEERLARAKARIMGETSTTIFCLLNFAFKILIILKFFLDLTAQLESLRSATDHVTGFVNARGTVPVVRLHDIPNRVREVALHGVCHGAAMALAPAQARSSHNLWLLPHDFPDATHPGDHERLVEDFFDAANSVAFTTQANDIVNKVFPGL